MLTVHTIARMFVQARNRRRHNAIVRTRPLGRI